MLRPLFRTYRSQWEYGLESSTGHTLPAAEARRAPSIRDEISETSGTVRIIPIELETPCMILISIWYELTI